MEEFKYQLKEYLWWGTLFLGSVAGGFLATTIFGADPSIGMIFGVVAFLLLDHLWKSRHNGKFREFQYNYEKARKTSIANPNLSFNSLPVFPVKAPYASDKEQRSRQLAAATTGSLDMIMNHYLGKIRSVMPELLYMRGDNHEAWGSNSRVLLMIEEVEQAKRELAIVALVVQKRGTIANVSIRRSCWPTTLHSDAPRSKATKKRKGFRCDTPYETCFRRFFAPIEWETSNLESYGNLTMFTLQPCFHAETEEAAEAIASGVLACLSDEM